MEKLIQHYLRILDVDPSGYFIRLINTSFHQAIDLSNIHIQQTNSTNQTLNLYIFHDKLQPLLPNGEVVTIYSRDYRQLKFDIAPHTFIAQDIFRWFIDDHIQTVLSLNNIVFHRYKHCLLTTNDVPLLFIKQSMPTQQQLPTESLLHSERYSDFVFPYCLSTDNIVNPHTWAKSDGNARRDSCYGNNQRVKDFNSYARRLTTAPKENIPLPRISHRMGRKMPISVCTRNASTE